MSVEALPVPLSSFGLTTMEDRKRPAIAEIDDGAPPPKRQATLNGTKSQGDGDAALWKNEDIQEYQKDAILRQMREYKREKQTLEGQVADMEKRSAYHDDHIRAIDLWFTQLVDEIRILAADTSSLGKPVDSSEHLFPSSLLFADQENFQQHVQSRTTKIKSALSDLFSRMPSASSEASHLQQQLSRLLASEKDHLSELHRLRTDKEQLSERLENASYRYMVAEKKLERAKSAAVLKLEKQALHSTGAEETSKPKKEESVEVNGVVDTEALESAEATRKEALAAADKRKEQLDLLEAKNLELTQQVTSLNARLAALSSDDFAHTDLFKGFKTQHDEIVKRVNDLEATNIQLREEAKRLQAERLEFQMRQTEETQAATASTEADLAKAEGDITRIRHARDELLAERDVLKATSVERKTAAEQLKELTAAREARIKALENEVERLKISVGQAEDGEGMEVTRNDLESMDAEQLRAKIVSLEKEAALLKDELPSMAQAYNKAQSLASKKVAELQHWEQEVQRLTAEKEKANQKYFQTMKLKDALEYEKRTMTSQVRDGAKMVASLKASEHSATAACMNMEKQLAETKDALQVVQTQYRSAQQDVAKHSTSAESLTSQVVELKKLLTAKDESVASSSKAQRKHEVELEELKARLESTNRSLENWKQKSMANVSEDAENWRRALICGACRTNFKNTVIKSCGHVHCQDCVEERISSRSRKCPSCGKSFGASDHMKIVL